MKRAIFAAALSLICGASMAADIEEICLNSVDTELARGACFQASKKYYRLKDYRPAHRYARRGAELGSAKAMYFLAELHDYSMHKINIAAGIVTDYEENSKKFDTYMAKACDMGAGIACGRLGSSNVINSRYEGGAERLDKGLKQLKLGCKLKSAESCYYLANTLGDIYRKTVRAKDSEGAKARAYLLDKYQRACKYGPAERKDYGVLTSFPDYCAEYPGIMRRHEN